MPSFHFLRTGLAQMWAEGPGGWHDENMRSTSYRTVGCGIYVNNGEVTVTQVTVGGLQVRPKESA